MRTIKQALAQFSMRIPSPRRWLPAALVMFLPTVASAAQAGNAAAATNSTFMVFGDYLRLPVTQPARTSLQGLFTEAVARDLMIGLLLAICVAMVIGASFLWRENVSHLRADAERQKQRETLDLL